MARELFYVSLQTGVVGYYAVVQNRVTKQFWNGSAFEDLAVGNWGNYDYPLTENPTGSYVYAADMPATLPQGDYIVQIRERVYAQPAIDDPKKDSYELGWSGSSVINTLQADSNGKVAIQASDIANIAATVGSRVIEGSYTQDQLLRLMAAALLGVVSGVGSGTVVIRAAGSPGQSRIQAQIDANRNRVAVQLTP